MTFIHGRKIHLVTLSEAFSSGDCSSRGGAASHSRRRRNILNENRAKKNRRSMLVATSVTNISRINDPVRSASDTCGRSESQYSSECQFKLLTHPHLAICIIAHPFMQMKKEKQHKSISRTELLSYLPLDVHHRPAGR